MWFSFNYFELRSSGLLGDDDFDALDGLGGGEGGVDAEIGEAVVDCQDVAAIAGVHGPAAR